jgi:hypothetical protein
MGLWLGDSAYLQFAQNQGCHPVCSWRKCLLKNSDPPRKQGITLLSACQYLCNPQAVWKARLDCQVSIIINWKVVSSPIVGMHRKCWWKKPFSSRHLSLLTRDGLWALDLSVKVLKSDLITCGFTPCKGM